MKFFGSLLLAFFLAACGGGSGSSPAPATPAVVIDPNMTVPLQTAYANIAKVGLSGAFKVSGWQDNSTALTKIPLVQFSGSGNLSMGAAVAGTLNGAPALVASQSATGTIFVDGSSQGSTFASVTAFYFDPTNFALLGSGSGNGLHVAYDKYAIPATVKAGSSGFFGTTSNRGYSYIVSANDATSLLFTTIDASRIDERTTNVYRIDTAGNVKFVSATTTLSFIGTPYKSLTYTF